MALATSYLPMGCLLFTSLSHAHRSARLEWIIIILITIEIVLFLLEMVTNC